MHSVLLLQEMQFLHRQADQSQTLTHALPAQRAKPRVLSTASWGGGGGAKNKD